MKIAKACLTILAVVTLAPAWDGDTFAAKFDALPAAVKQTARAHMEKAFPVSITSAKGASGWDYQINTRVDGRYHDLVIDASGKLVAVKDETDVAALPAAARAALEKQTANARIVTLEKVTEGGDVSYGAVVRNDAQGTVTQVKIAADGTVKPR